MKRTESVDVAVADKKSSAAMTIEIATIPPASPPAMAPVFESYPSIGMGAAEFEEEPRESLLVGYELDAGVEG